MLHVHHGVSFQLEAVPMAYDEYYRSQPSGSRGYGGDNSNSGHTVSRARQDSFSGRFSNTVNGDGSSSMPRAHPAALTTGSALYLPPSTQLREDRVNKLINGTGEDNHGPRSMFQGEDTNTITPFDSISNVDARDDADADDDGVSRYTGNDYLSRDPYARPGQAPSRQKPTAYSKSYNTRPRSGSAGEGYDPRDSNGSLPLMQNAVQPAGSGSTRGSAGSPSYYPESIIDGDTVIQGNGARRSNQQSYYTSRELNPDEVERVILTQNNLGEGSYPPPPRYDTPDTDEKGDPFTEGKDDSRVSTVSGRNRSGKRPNVWLRQLRDTTPLEEKIKNHKNGIGIQDRPWACWVIALILVVVFIVELIKSVSRLSFIVLGQSSRRSIVASYFCQAQKTGKAISTSPFNYMIGPSSEMLINLGARFTACMRSIPEITSTPFRCLNDSSTSTSSITTTCTLEDICGFGGFGSSGVPDQTFRFFTPLWLHVGVVHLLLNGLVLLTSSALVEKQMGSLR